MTITKNEENMWIENGYVSVQHGEMRDQQQFPLLKGGWYDVQAITCSRFDNSVLEFEVECCEGGSIDNYIIRDNELIQLRDTILAEIKKRNLIS